MKPKVLNEPSRKQPFRTYEVRNLAQLMELVKLNQFQKFTTIFRGQSEDLPLVPKVGRMPLVEPEPVLIRPPGVVGSWYSGPVKDPLLWMEKNMLEEFERKALALVNSLPSDLWEVLALAQHHGLPTRLLDWTYNPYVAAWFAVGRPPLPSQRPGVIWIHVPDSTDLVSLSERHKKSPLEVFRPRERPVVFEPRHVTPRIRAQDGLFTVQQYNERHRKFRASDEVGSHRWCMTKAIVPTKYFSRMCDELNLVGVNASSLFPDLDGLARKISDAYTIWP